jgi:hypothetical protein
MGGEADVGEVLLRFARSLERLRPDGLVDLIERSCLDLGAREVEVLLADIEQVQLRDPRGESSPVEIDSSDAGRAYRTERVVAIEQHDRTTRLWIPLIDSAQRLGVLGVSVPSAHPDPQLWAGFAGFAAESLVTKSSYGDRLILARRSKEVSLAAEMRWAMLPPLTFSTWNVEISGLLEPAYDIAGDAFDYAVNGPVVSLAVLDAMGHGLEASRIANLAVAAYRNSRRRSLDLREMFREIDQAVADEIGDHRFVTGQLAELDTTTGVLRLVNAGHPLPLLFRQGRDIGDVPCRPCLPLGLGGMEAHEARYELEPGDVVVFHTDGVTEARSATGEEFGRERLGTLVSGSLQARDRPAEVLRQVVRAAHDHGGAQLRDDATLVLLSWLGDA